MAAQSTGFREHDPAGGMVRVSAPAFAPGATIGRPVVDARPSVAVVCPRGNARPPRPPP